MKYSAHPHFHFCTCWKSIPSTVQNNNVTWQVSRPQKYSLKMVINDYNFIIFLFQSAKQPDSKICITFWSWLEWWPFTFQTKQFSDPKSIPGLICKFLLSSVLIFKAISLPDTETDIKYCQCTWSIYHWKLSSCFF